MPSDGAGAASQRSALQLTGVVRRFGATVALRGVDLAVHPGEVHALIGENGAGKSTLMGVIAGAIRPDAGSMQLHGAPYAPATPLDARRRGVALIHQELSLCSHLTVTENVLLGAEPARLGWIDRAGARARARALLDELPHPDIHPDRLVRDLPIPARQIVEICRALAANARVVLMDEPTSSLQGADVDRLFALIRRLTARGVAVIYISHFLEEVRQIADSYTVLRDGQRVSGGRIAGTTNPELIERMVGRDVTELFPVRARQAPGKVVLSVRGLASPPVLRDASFELQKGEVLGIGGLVGSGRTELVRALFGLDQPSAGTIALHATGATVARGSTPSRVRAGLGFMSEDRTGEGLALPLSLVDNVCATRPLLKLSALGLLDRARQATRTRHWMQVLHVRAASPAQPVRSLSGGNQQKVALARLLHQEAEILLLDEPTRGIDIGSRAEVYEVIARQAAAGCAILIVSSYLPELFGLCDRLAVMCKGRLTPARPIADWSPQEVLATAIGSTM